MTTTTTSYLITDTLTGDATWVAAASVREALIARENELRAAATVYPRAGKPALPAGTQVSHYSEGHIIDVSVADVACRGRRENVVREESAMTNYIVIDGYAGEVMGEAEAATPAEAVRQVYQAADRHRDFDAEYEIAEHGPNWGTASRGGPGNGAQAMDNCAFVHVGSDAETDRVAVVEIIRRTAEW